MKAMSAERWRSVRGAFDRVLAAEGDERKQVLRNISDDLRIDVEELIASYEAIEVSGRLDQGILQDSLSETVDSPAAPEFIGAYRIVRRLGEGGMGVVLLAEQARPRRLVAVKVIRSSRVSEKSIHRFQREAELLARLQHPHIAQLIELGEDKTPDGQTRHFIVMEYVHGRRLCDRDDDEREPTRTELIELLIGICEGVQHAHLNGVIHRDLKPGNVLVAPDGSPKIVDFGVARLVASESPGFVAETLTSDLVGTLPYMSPEQISPKSAGIDTRTDVYALGVIGLEMLTGEHPCADIDPMLGTLVEFVTNGGPANVALHSAALPEDLRFVLAKALAPQPSQRYDSAAEFASDLRRFLNRDAVSAKPPSFVYQVRVLARKNIALVMAAASIAVILITASAVSTHYAIAAGEAAREATREAVRVGELRTVLERIFSWAAPDRSADPNITLIGALQRVVAEIKDVKDPQHRAALHHLASDAFLSFCVAETPEAGSLYEMATTHAKAAVEIARLEHGASHSEVAYHLVQLGKCQSAMSRYQDSRASLNEAISIYEKAEPRNLRHLLDALLVLATDEMQQRRYDDAQSHIQRAMELAAGDPQLLAAIRADALLVTADIANGKGERESAEAGYREAMAACDSAPELRPTLKPAIISKLGVVLADMGKTDEALECQTRALEMRKTLLPPQHPGLAASFAGVAQLYFKVGRYQEALPYAQSALDSYRRAYGDEPHLYVARTQHWIGKILANLNRHDEAIVQFGAAADLYARISGADELNIAAARSDRGESLMRLGRLDEAELDLREARRIFSESKNADASRVQRNKERLDDLRRRRENTRNTSDG